MDKWYHISVTEDKETRWYVCQFEKTIEEDLLSKKDDDFIQIKKVCWTEKIKGKEEKLYVVKLEESNDGKYTDTIYVRRSFIGKVYPIAENSIYNKEYK